MTDNTADLQSIERFRAGDTTAFEELVLRYQDRVYNLCRSMLVNPSDAEDAAQDTFIKAFRSLGGFRPEAAFYTWLYRIAVNTCLDHKKKPFFESLFSRSVEGAVHAYEPTSGDPSPERLYASKQIQQTLAESLGRLSPKLRAVIVLKELEGLSYEEIAAVMEVSTGTVKSRIFRAREELQKDLGHFREQK